MPRLLSDENRAAFASRLAEYVLAEGIERVAVVFHGGEPLLMGVDSLIAFACRIRAATSASVDIGFQTNGLLLTEAAIDAFEAADIAISLSLDGPKNANDKHRTTRRGRSSFDRVIAALERLKQHPKVFAGIIAVIDATTSPADLFAFFDQHGPPKLDFLLPDANHLRPPPGRDRNPDLYGDWLIEAFDLWLDRYPHLPVRTFEALLDTVAGLRSGTDAFGLGDVSLLTIETDGSYHDLDVLKVTGDGATKLSGTLRETAIADVAGCEGIATHRLNLRKEGLCTTCQACSVVEICGGGSLPHRFGQTGFDNPTVYCGEMLRLIAHVRYRLEGFLKAAERPECIELSFELDAFEEAEGASTAMSLLCTRAGHTLRSELVEAVEVFPENSEELADLKRRLRALSAEHLAEIARQPGAVAWQRTVRAQATGSTVYAVDGTPITAGSAYVWKLLERPEEKLSTIAVGEVDEWLRLPFGRAIYFEDEERARQALLLIEEAFAIIDRWRPALGAEIRQACRAIQFVRDPTAHADKIVSFSDNTVPGALYVSVVQGGALIDPYDLADSLVHEHRHQKLYLLERLAPTVGPTDMVVVSPWREDLRPPSGLLHALFVFVELRRLWVWVRDNGPARLRNRALNQIRETDKHLAEGFATLESCPLTDTGRRLVAVLKRSYEPEAAPA